MTTTTNWDSPDWLKSVQIWTNNNLVKMGLEPVGELQKVSGWSLGYILKQDTNRGYYFFKATAFLPLFSNESQLCLKLTQLLPAYVPTTLFSLNQNQWMLSEYFGGSLPENADNLLWRGAFSQFAKLQIESTRHISELISNGCLQRSITDLPALLSEILNDLDITSSLPVKVSTHKNNLIVTVTNYIEELQQFALSDTLVHGDLHIENIAQQNNDFIFFDWSDACISHPFIDGTYIYRMPDSVEKQNIIEAYLTPWLYLADMATLKRAWSKAELVCYAHQAISYASMKKTLSNEQMKDLEQVYLNAFNRLVNFSCLADPNNHADEFIT